MLKLIISALMIATPHVFAQGAEDEITKLEQIRSEQNEYYENIERAIRLGIPFDVAGDSCKYISSIFQPPPNRIVTLTFDDGPAVSSTSQVLDVLKKHGVSATFFIKGQNANGKAKILSRMVNENHIVAAHSYTHSNFHQLSKGNQSYEVTQTEKVIGAYMPNGLKLFRYPYGNSTCYTNSVVKKSGYAGIVGWHVDSCDWAFSSKGYVTDKQAKICAVRAQNKANFVGHVISEVNRHNGGIILMHDIHQRTAASVEEIIVRLKQAGYSFVNLDQPIMKSYFR